MIATGLAAAAAVAGDTGGTGSPGADGPNGGHDRDGIPDRHQRRRAIN